MSVDAVEFNNFLEEIGYMLIGEIFTLSVSIFKYQQVMETHMRLASLLLQVQTIGISKVNSPKEENKCQQKIK